MSCLADCTSADDEASRAASSFPTPGTVWSAARATDVSPPETSETIAIFIANFFIMMGSPCSTGAPAGMACAADYPYLLADGRAVTGGRRSRNRTRAIVSVRWHPNDSRHALSMLKHSFH